MTIKIAYLYYDLLNLNGENGNIKVLKHQLEKQNIQIEIILLTTIHEIEPDQYDVFYIGGGTDQNLQIAKKHFLKYQTQIEEAIESHKFFIVTGNALELFGPDGINIFKYQTKEVAIFFREVAFEAEFIAKPIIGFLNQKKDIISNEYPFFKNSPEGIRYLNFFGTKLFGPILVKNPLLLEYFVKQIILYKDPFFMFQPIEFEFEETAYLNYQKMTNQNLI